MIYITRKLDFCASHRLFNPDFTEEQNKTAFGLCSNPNGHGHTYTLEVTIRGEVNPQTGMIMDFKNLKELVKTEIIHKVDHKNLNVDVPFLDGVISTVENMAVAFWRILEPRITNGVLHEIKLYESERNYVVYRGKSHERVS